MATPTLQLQVHYVEGDTTSMFEFPPGLTVSQACQTIEEHFCEGEPDREFGLVRPSGKDPQQGQWLEQQHTLSDCALRTGDCVQFRCRHYTLTVKTLEGAVLNLMVDESQNVKELIEAACAAIGVKSSEEFAFVTEEDLSKRRRASLLSGKKLKSLRRKRYSGDVKWLSPSKTLREQGVREDQVLVLRKRFFFSDEMVDGCETAEMGLVYVQSRNGVLHGTYPVSKEEAIQFAALQCQVEMGDYSTKEHKQGCLRLASFLPKEYVKSKNIEKKILEEYQKLPTQSEHSAKARYIQVCRSLKTFGVTFFAVKEKMKGRNKMVPRLLGITRENITKMDDKTKEVLEVWPLHTVRRWASTPSSFSLDFGGYSDSFYSVRTTEGDAISQLISGYVDITVKKKRAREWRNSDLESVSSGAGSLEDSLEMPLDEVDGGSFAVEVTSTDLESLLQKAILSCNAAASQLAPSQVNTMAQHTPATQVATISSAVVAILSSTAKLLASSAVELNSVEQVKMAASFKTMAMGLSSLVTAAQSAAAACPTPEDREHLLDTAHKLSIAAVHVLNTVQELKNKDKLQELQAAVRAVGTAGEYLLHVCEVPVLDLSTQKVISVSSQDIIRRSAYLGQIAVNVVETCSAGDSDGGDSVKHRVDEVVDDLLDKSSVLAVSASLLSPLLAHPSCQESLTEAVKMVADAAEKTGVLTQPVCSSDSALSELAEAGSAVIDELQSLLAELSRCSLMSVCHHLEQNLDLLSHAADNIVHCTSGTADMLREAKSIGKGFECMVDLLNLQSEREDDPSAARALLDASKSITRASLNVIEGAKKLSYDADGAGQAVLKAAAAELQTVCASVSMLLLTKHSAPRLEVAASNACTVTAQLVLAALEVSQDAGTGDSVQAELEERSEAAQRDVLALLKVLKGAQSGNLPLTITTQAALSLVASAGLLVGAVKSCVTILSDQAGSVQLSTLARATNTAVGELKMAANKALRVTQMEDLASCSELLHGMLTEAGLSRERLPASGDMVHLSAAEYKARLSAAVQAVAAAKSSLLASLGGTSIAKMVAATKDYVQAVKAWCNVMSVQEQNQDAVKEVLELTGSIVLEVKAAAGTGGSIMAAVSKLEEVTLCMGAAAESIEGGNELSSSGSERAVKKRWWKRVVEWTILPVYRLIVWLLCLPYLCARYLLMKVYTAVCFVMSRVYSAAAWSMQVVYRCARCSLRMAFSCLYCVCPPLWLGNAVLKYARKWKGKPVAHRTTVLVNDNFSDTSSYDSSFDLSDDGTDYDENDPAEMPGGIPDLIPNPRGHVSDKSKLKLE